MVVGDDTDSPSRVTTFHPSLLQKQFNVKEGLLCYRSEFPEIESDKPKYIWQTVIYQVNRTYPRFKGSSRGEAASQGAVPAGERHVGSSEFPNSTCTSGFHCSSMAIGPKYAIHTQWCCAQGAATCRPVDGFTEHVTRALQMAPVAIAKASLSKLPVPRNAHAFVGGNQYAKFVLSRFVSTSQGIDASPQSARRAL